ncbi:MAG: GNAT family N-acetyltransferase [Alphaproteobacteria bacterium]|nr:GNAT family N-acetyltransferase [Alphaproteobacteria bacterium]
MSRIGKPGGSLSKPANANKRKGKKDAPAPVPTTVTYLQMFAEPLLNVPPPAQKIALMKAEKPPVHYTRYLYGTVGADYMWVDQMRISDADLAATVQDDKYETYVLMCDGCPAGYFELDCRQMPEIELAYFGLVPEYAGRGLGKYLLAQAIKIAWSHNPERLHVETCTLDHPAALPLYQKCGFTPYAQKDKEMFPLE